MEHLGFLNKETGTMAYHHKKADKIKWRACMRCGQELQLLSQGYALALLGVDGSEQRGFQCIVCGQITCFGCSDNRYRCTCGGNAWIARVYKGRVLDNVAAAESLASRLAWHRCG